MAEKDIIEKTLEAYNDVFSDIFNGLLFNGKPVIGENQLTDATEYSMYKADGKLHQQERDVAKYWDKTILRAALFGIENQSAIDPDMPFRVIGYDGAAYRNQLNTEMPQYYPVITIVLYFGKGKWKNNKSLYDVLDISDELKPFVSDYKINVFSVSEFTEDQVKLFKSDFRLVADYFVKTRTNPNYRGSQETIKHVDEFFKLMAVFSGDNRFEVAYNEESKNNKEKGGKVNNMCEFLDKIENEGIEKGIEKVILRMLEKDYSLEEIKQITGASEEKIKEMKEKLVCVK